MTLICKDKGKGLNMRIDGAKLTMFSIGTGSAKRVLEVMQHVTTRTAAYFGSMTLKTCVPDAVDVVAMSMDAAFRATESLTSTELAAAVGDARLKPEDQRTDLDRVLVRCETQLKQMRAKADRARCLIRELGDETPFPFHEFVGLDALMGEAVDPRTSLPVTMSFSQFASSYKHNLKYSCCLLGRPGLGKTPLAQSLCHVLATAYQGNAYGTEPARCYYLQANTVDMLKEFNQGGVLRSYTPVFLDEFEAADVRQQGIMGENSLKVLTDVREGGTIRARYHDVLIPPRVPRVFAANVLSADAWFASIGAEEQHRMALRKRTLFFVLTQSVMPDWHNTTMAEDDIDPAFGTALQAVLENRG